MTKQSGYIPIDSNTVSSLPSKGLLTQRFDGSTSPASRPSKHPFGWTKIPCLSKFSNHSTNIESTKPLPSCSVPSTPLRTCLETLPPSDSSKSSIEDYHSDILVIPGVGKIYPWSSCVWKPKDYQRHAKGRSCRNNLAEAGYPKVSRLGLLLLEPQVVQSHYPWHMQKESAKPTSMFTNFHSSRGIDEDYQEEDDYENIEESLFCGKQLYPTRYFVSSIVDSPSQTMNDALLPMISSLSEPSASPIFGTKVSSSHETDVQNWTEYDEWYTRTYHQWIGYANASSHVHDERIEFPYLRLNRASLPKDSLMLYKELDPFKIQSYSIQSKRVASTMYTYSAIVGCTISPGKGDRNIVPFTKHVYFLFFPKSFAPPPLCLIVPNIMCLSTEYGLYVCDIGLKNRQCDLIIQTAERCANGTYAAYTYAKQTLGCRDYDALGLVCGWPVLKVCATINKYLENNNLHENCGGTVHDTNNKAGVAVASRSTTTNDVADPRRRILTLDDREPHIGEIQKKTSLSFFVLRLYVLLIPILTFTILIFSLFANTIQVKYDVSKKERQKLDMHTVKSEWTFIIALSEGRGKDYECGGTYIEVIDSTIHLQRGQVLIFPGKLRHRGQKITKGVRFLLVGFMVDKGPNHIDPSSSSLVQ